MITLNLLVLLNVLIISSLLFFRKNNTLPNKILALIFLIPGLNFANNINILAGTIYSFPYPYFVVQGTALLFAPAVYYYILLLIGKKITRHKVLLIFSGLLLCFDIYMGIEFAFFNKTAQHQYITSLLQESYPIEMELFAFLVFIHQLIYFTLGIKEVYLYSKNTKDVFSDIKATKYAYLIRFIVLLWVLTALTVIMYAFIETRYVEYVFLPLVILTIYFFILYYAFHNHAVFTYQSFNVLLDSEVNPKIQGLAKNVSEEKQLFPEELPEKIHLYVNEKEVFKNPEISVYKLAEALDFPTYQVSKAINQGLKTNFYDLINKSRVEEAKILLTQTRDHNLSIEGIAFEVGFNSRTAFYRAFKKYTGKNPSDFKD